MLLTKRKKKIIGISLISLLVCVISIAMIIGVVFIALDKSSGLSRQQLEFGRAVSSSGSSVLREDIDISQLPSEIDAGNILLSSENYVAVKEADSVLIYSKQKHDFIELDNALLNVEKISNNVALVETSRGRELLNLLTGKTISFVASDGVYFAGNYCLLKSNSFGTVSYLANSSTGLCALVLNTETCELEKAFERTENIIGVELTDHFFIVQTATKTLVYSLDKLSLIKSYDNISSNGKKNVKSGLTGEEYCIMSFYSAFELGENCLLIERNYVVSGGYDLLADGLDGDKVGYKIEYKVLGRNGVEQSIDNENCVMRPEKTGIAGYVAIVYSAIENNMVSSTKQNITYFQYGSQKLTKLVTYDYVENGKLVGYNNKTFLTQGGKNSGSLDFNGKTTKVVDAKLEDRIVDVASDNAVVVSSMLGFKQLYKKDGTKLSDDYFALISPFVSGKALAWDLSDFYVLSANGAKNKVEIDNEFIDYMFMGIGMYFVKSGENYNVYDMNGVKLYSAAKLGVQLLGNDEVLLSISTSNENKLMKIKALKSYSHISPMSASIQNQPEVQSFDANSFLESEDKLAIVGEPIVDKVAGYGFIKYGFEVSTKDLKLKNYDALTDAEKALVPRFDQKNSFESADGKLFYFRGAYFLTNTNIAVAIIKLEHENRDYFFVNIALKDVYLNSVSGKSSTAFFEDDLMTFERGRKQSLPLDFAADPVAASALEGVVATCFDETGEAKVDYSKAGYDGGIVLVSNNATKLSVEIELKNVYSSEKDTGYIDIRNIVAGENVYEFGKFDVVINSSQNASNVTLRAKDGYMFGGFSYTYANASASVCFSKQDMVKSVKDIVCSTYTFELNTSFDYIRLCPRLIEEYIVLNVVDEDNSNLLRTYYFNGFGSDVGGGSPAPFGFSEFNRVDKIQTMSKEGYTFVGYKQEGSEECAINSKGMLVGTINSDSGYIKQVDIKPSYEANQYTIFFHDENGEILNSQKMTFDEVVPTLYEYNKEYYDFLGWYTNRSGGTQFIAGTKCVYSRDLDLYARIAAKKVAVTFDLNLDNYNNGNIDGKNYEISNVYFKNAFDSYSKDAQISSNFTKEYTYNQTYGTLPVLYGTGSNGKEYTLVGWSEDNIGNADSATKIENSSNVINVDGTEKLTKTIYAQYAQVTYNINVTISVGNGFESLEYSGGANGSISPDSGTSARRSFSISVPSGGDLTLVFTQIPGYYIRRLTVSKGGSDYSFNGTYDNKTDTSNLGSQQQDDTIHNTDGILIKYKEEVTTITFSGLTQAGSINFEMASTMSSVSVKSYLGVDGNMKYDNPLVNHSEVCSNIITDYKDAKGKDVKAAYAPNQTIYFTGNQITFTISKLDGYKFSELSNDSYELTGDGVGVLTPSITDSAGEKTLKYTLPYQGQQTLSFVVRQKAITYNIEYKLADGFGSLNRELKTTGVVYDDFEWTLPSKSELSNYYSSTDYVLLGYSTENKTGNDLSDSDAEFKLGGNLTRNLTSVDGATVTLYIIAEPRTYNVIFDANGGRADYSSGRYKLFHQFSSLPSASRIGHVFNGWQTSNNVKIEQTTTLTREIASTASGDNITLSASWTAITYRIIIHTNDYNERSGGGFGSTNATGKTSGYQITFGGAEISMEALSRQGYNFLGFKSVRLNATTQATDSRPYLGYGPNAIKNINENNYSSWNANDSTKTIDLYAVYSPKTYTYYINLNNKNLAHYGTNEGNIVVSYNGRSYTSNQSYFSAFTCTVTFDTQFGTLPSIGNITGYDFAGYSILKQGSMNMPNGYHVTSDTIFNGSYLSNARFYSGENDEAGSSVGSETIFSIMAYYTVNSYTVSYFDESGYNNGFHLSKSLDSYSNYSHSSVTRSDSASQNSTTINYGKDAILDIIPLAGNYVQSIDITDGTSTFTLTFSWNSANGAISLAVNGSAKEMRENEFVNIAIGGTSYRNIYLKLLPYNRNGSTSNNFCRDAYRIILGFQYVKGSFSATIRTGAVQRYDVHFYYYFDRPVGGFTPPESEYASKTYSYGDPFSEQDLGREFFPLYEFNGVRYGSLSGSSPSDPSSARIASVGDEVKMNLTMVAFYKLVEKQGLNFWFFDRVQNKYVTNEEMNQRYVLFELKNNSISQGSGIMNFDSQLGQTTYLPTSASEAWPDGVEFVGFIIPSSNPLTTTYYTASSLANNQNYSKATIVDHDINVYAVYNENSFGFSMNVSGSNISANLDDFSIFEYGEDGASTQVRASSVYILSLNATQMQAFTNNIAEGVQTALGIAVGGSLENVSLRTFTSGGQLNFSRPSSQTYYFAITIRTNDMGQPYIYRVAKNYYSCTGTSVTRVDL